MTTDLHPAELLKHDVTITEIYLLPGEKKLGIIECIWQRDGGKAKNLLNSLIGIYFLKFRLNLSQILIIKKYVAWFLDSNKEHKTNNK